MKDFKKTAVALRYFPSEERRIGKRWIEHTKNNDLKETFFSFKNLIADHGVLFQPVSLRDISIRESTKKLF